MKHRVSFAFAKKKDADLIVYCTGVHDALVDNPAEFAGSPVSAVALATANADFSIKLAAVAQGGTTATTAKNVARASVIGLLRQIALWLEGQAQGRASFITLAGHDVAVRGAFAQTPLPKPAILAILNNMSTQLQLRVTSLRNARSYEVQRRTGNGAWTAAVVSQQARVIVVPDLVPGTLYSFRVRAVGGSTGYSDWSDAVSHMSL
jgi:hypothetical protein